MAIRLKAGAPPDEELFVRVGVTRTWKPKLGPEHYPAIPAEDTYNGEPIPEPTNMLEVMLYDKDAVDEGMSAIQELVECSTEVGDPEADEGPVDFTRNIWEIVDRYGNVWSEEYEE